MPCQDKPERYACKVFLLSGSSLMTLNWPLLRVPVQVRDVNLAKLMEVATTLQDFSMPDLGPTQQFGPQCTDTNPL